MFVYVISAGEGRQKIGMTSNVKSRLASLQTASPVKLTLVHARETVFAARVEKHVHDLMQERRLSGEWFDLSEELAVAFVNGAVENFERSDTAWYQFGGWQHSVGDYVECREELDPAFPAPRPVMGRFYTVSRVYPEGQVDLAEIPNDWFCHSPSNFWPALHAIQRAGCGLA